MICFMCSSRNLQMSKDAKDTQTVLKSNCESLFKKLCLSYSEKCPSEHNAMCPSDHNSQKVSFQTVSTKNVPPNSILKKCLSKHFDRKLDYIPPHTQMPGLCSGKKFDINFGNRLYSNEKRPGSLLLF